MSHFFEGVGENLNKMTWGVKGYLFAKQQIIPANTNHLYNICTMLRQRRRRWAVVVVYKCFVYAEI